MKRFHVHVFFFAIFLALASQLPTQAAIDYSGNLNPADPNTWTSSTYAYIGYTNTSSPGQIEVNGGSTLLSSYAYLGYNPGTSGTVTVTGTGSTWNNSNHIYVGEEGNGTLNITNRGTVYNSICMIGNKSGATGSVTVNGTGSTLSSYSSFNKIYVGSYGNGTLSITGGGTVSDRNGYIGYESGSTGSATVDGAGSTWNNSSELAVGRYGSGSLSITGGATVNNRDGYIGSESGSTGTVTVDGAGSTWNNTGIYLVVGFHGSGSLDITNGGTVNVTGSTYAGNNGSNGSINFGASGGTLTTGSFMAPSAQLFGTGTINTNGIASDYDLVLDSAGALTQTLTIGGSGQARNITVNLDLSGLVRDLGVNHGSLAIDGIAMSSLYGLIGYYPGSTGVVTVDGAGSVWNNTASIELGNSGNGTLSITNGGTVSNDYCFLAKNPGSTATVIVDGAGSTCSNGSSLLVGDYGIGTLWITNGGTFSNKACVIGLHESGSTSVVTVDGAGSTWTNGSSICVGAEGSGTLNITNGGLVVSETLRMDYDADGDGVVNMSDGGMLALVGDADDSLATFFDLMEGTDAIQWWDPEASGWNSLTSAVMGDDYTLEYFSAGDLAGYTLLTVTAIEPVPGDINCDGMVDSSDFAILANNWQAGVSDGQTANWAMGDFNDDHRVDSSDFAIMANNWQSGVGLSLSNIAVPEPGSVAMLLTLVAVGMVVRVRKSRR